MGPDAELYSFYSSEENGLVGLYLGLYWTQKQGAELIGSQNVMAPQMDPVWAETKLTTRSVRLGAEDEVVNESELKSNRAQRLLVWSWYRVGDRYTADPYVGKFYEVLARLFSGRRDGALIAVAAPYEDKRDAAAARLQAFLNQMLPSIEKELDRVMNEAQ